MGLPEDIIEKDAPVYVPQEPQDPAVNSNEDPNKSLDKNLRPNADAPEPPRSDDGDDRTIDKTEG